MKTNIKHTSIDHPNDTIGEGRIYERTGHPMTACSLNVSQGNCQKAVLSGFSFEIYLSNERT
jgi:hypothetical protein